MSNFFDELTEHVRRDLNPFIYPKFEMIVGSIQRFDISKANDKAGWIIINDWDFKGNIYYCAMYSSFKGNQGTHRYSSNKQKGKAISKAESNAVKDLSKKADDLKKQKHLDCKSRWEPIFNTLPINSNLHGYLQHKNVNSNYNTRIDNNGVLYIPLYNKEGFTGTQRIFWNIEKNEWEKKFTFGINMDGSFYPFGTSQDMLNSNFIYIAEGFATSATVYEVTGIPTVCCFNAGNISKCIALLKEFFPNKRICIAADNDDSKTGYFKAEQACKDFDDVIYKMPQFEHKTPNLSDFNDLLMVSDSENVLSQLRIMDPENFDTERFAIDVRNRFNKLNDETGKPLKDYDRLIGYFHAKNRYMRMTDIKRTMIFDGRVFKFTNDEIVGKFAIDNFQKASVKEVDEFVRKTRLFHQIDHCEFSQTAQSEGFINLKNGVYEIATKRLLPHNHSYRFQYYVPVDYDPDAKCPVWDKLLENLTMERKELQDIINEFMGMSISNMTYEKFNKALILDGKGSNGKSTLLTAIREVLGENNCSNIPMGDMSKNRFLSYGLLNKLINVSEEEDKSVFGSTGMFKKLTGNTPIHVEQKGKQGFDFLSRAKIIMTYNEIPFLSDMSDGMIRRLLIVAFEMNTKTMPDRKIANVIELIKKEKAGIVNKWLHHLHLLLDRGEFTESFLVHNKVNQLMISSDSVLAFFSENVELTENNVNFIPLSILFSKYQEDCGRSNRTGPRKFADKIKKYFNYKITQRRWSEFHGFSKKNHKGFAGVKFKDSSIYSEFNGVSE